MELTASRENLTTL